MQHGDQILLRPDLQKRLEAAHKQVMACSEITFEVLGRTRKELQALKDQGKLKAELARVEATLSAEEKARAANAARKGTEALKEMWKIVNEDPRCDTSQHLYTFDSETGVLYYVAPFSEISSHA